VKRKPKSLIQQFQFRLFVLGLLLICASVAAIAFDGVHQRDKLVFEADRNIEFIGKSLVRDIERALDYGIPITQLAGVNPFMEDALRSYPRIKYLSLLSSNGHRLFSTGPEPVGSEAFAQEAAYKHFRDVLPTDVDGQRVAVLPVLLEGETVAGGLLIGSDIGLRGSASAGSFLAFTTVLIISLFTLVEVLVLVVGTRLVNSVRTCQKMMGTISVGDFRQRLGPQPQSQMGEFVRALNAVVDRVNEHYKKMQIQVDLVKDGAGDEAQILRKRLGAHISQLLNRVHFAEAENSIMPRERALSDFRAPIFLFAFVEAMSAPIFPQFVITRSDPIVGIDVYLLIGLPVSLFFLCLFVATPVAAYLSNRVRQKPILLAGALGAAVGFIGVSISDLYIDLLIWRCISAISYAFVITSFQSTIERMCSSDYWIKTLAFSLIVTVIGAGCGVVVGGMIAERLAYSDVFLVAAGVALIGGLTITLFMENLAPRSHPDVPVPGLWSRLRLLGNVRFLAAVAFGALPAKFVLSGVLLFIVPLFLSDLGVTPAVIGIIMVFYFAVVAAGTPLFHWLADKASLSMMAVFVGALVTCSGFLVLYQWHDVTAILIAICGLGVGHAMSVAPLLSLIPEVCEKEMETLGPSTVITTYRTLENMGGIAGPLAAAALVNHFGFPHAIAVMGLIVLGSALLLSFLFMVIGTSRSSDTTTLA